MELREDTFKSEVMLTLLYIGAFFQYDSVNIYRWFILGAWLSAMPEALFLVFAIVVNAVFILWSDVAALFFFCVLQKGIEIKRKKML